MEVKFELIDLLLVSPAIILFLASLIPLSIKVLRGNVEQNPSATLIYALIGIIGATGLTVANYGVNKLAFDGALVFDGIGTFGGMIILFVTWLSLLFARENQATNTNQFSEFTFLLMNSSVGMFILLWSSDLIVTFIGIEMMSLCLYIMIAMSHEEKLSKEASFKYFVLGSFASAIFLYGIAFIYGTVGVTTFPEITSVAAQLLSTNRLFLFGLIFVVLGLCFKVSIFPFHAWTPDVYQGAATPVTAFMATGVKAVTFAVFLRVIATEALLGEKAADFVVALQWLAVFTMVAGNIAAIMQNNFKRMLAYSSVAHSGYAMIGLIAAGIGGQGILGASGLIFYVFAYSIMTIGAFGVVCLFEQREDTVLNIDDLKGLASRSPWVALCITVFMLSLAGIPPTIGFFGKFFIFSAAIKQGLFWLAIWGVISSVISVYYYLRPVVMMYMRDEKGMELVPSRQLSHFAVGLSAVLVVVIGIAAEPFYNFVLKSVASLY